MAEKYICSDSKEEAIAILNHLEGCTRPLNASSHTGTHS
jgi:hypothetical protein